MYDPEIGRGCMIPLIQAVITGLLLGAVVLGGALWAGSTSTIAMYVALAAAGCAALWWWSTSISSWRRAVYPEPEPAPIGEQEPAPAPQIFRLEVKTGSKLQFAEFEGIEPDKLKRLAEGILQGIPFAESAWTGAGRPFSRSQFHQVRDIFLARGWLRWKNPESVSQGMIPTAQGLAVMRYFDGAQLDPPPHPIDSIHGW